MINGQAKALTKIHTKDIYWEYINNFIKTPGCIDKWMDLFPFLEKLDFKTIYILPYKIVREPHLQTFQYKILNRTLNCNYMLEKWSIIDSNLCVKCKNVDTLEHHLYYCNETNKFWNKVNTWVNGIFETNYEITICEIMLGIPEAKDPYLKSLNSIIILGKWFLNSKKTQTMDIIFFEFILLVKEKLETYRESSLIFGKIKEFERDYNTLYINI